MRLLFVELEAVDDKVMCKFNFGWMRKNNDPEDDNVYEDVQFTYEVDVTESAPIDYLNAAINAASMYMQSNGRK